MVSMDDAMKKAILDVHNKLRNDIASGKVEHYDQAANMMALQWDEGLAGTAAKNVHQCEMKHDDCRGTGKTARENRTSKNWNLNLHMLFLV